MGEMSWNVIKEVGLPKKTGWYILSIHEGEWIEEKTGRLIEPPVDRRAIGHFEIFGSGYRWSRIEELGYDELGNMYENTCVLTSIENDDGYDSIITAWCEIPEEAYREA